MLAPHRISSERPLTRPLARTGRRGAVAIEALFVILLLTIVVCGAFGLADLIIAEQRLDEACGRAARCAACGGTPDQIRECVIAVLGPERGKRAKIYVGPVGHRGNKGHDKGHDEGHPGHDRDRDGRDDHDRGRGPDIGKGHQNHDDSNFECHAVRCGELLEVCIELDACAATTTRLAPVRGSERLLARAVMQRE